MIKREVEGNAGCTSPMAKRRSCEGSSYLPLYRSILQKAKTGAAVLLPATRAGCSTVLWVYSLAER
jgi:hypothetical protein